jgi:4-hydroxymandelate oxidase
VTTPDVEPRPTEDSLRIPDPAPADGGVDLALVTSLTRFRPLAIERVEPAALDYIEGGSWDELSLVENEEAWLRRRLRPRVLADVARIDPSTMLLGAPSAMPVAVAPMAVHGLAHPDGELATARAAARAGIPFILSTMSSRSIEEVAAAIHEATRWFQLYVQVDPGRTRSLVERAAAAGYGAIVLTVDLPTLGYRERDRRNGFELDVPLGNFAGGPGPTHAHHGDGEIDLAAGGDWLARNLTWASLDTIRSWSGLPLVLKGVMTAEDARLAVDHGADAIVVSNHGARQLDRTAAPIDVLEEIRAAVPAATELWVDGGVRRGLDIAIALALGARGVLVGRPLLWALAAAGEAGVDRALAILREEFEIALALLGAPTPSEVRREHVAP